MNWLVIGLFSEGPTDRRFIPVILYRIILDALLEINWRQVEIQEEIIIYEEKANLKRCDRIIFDKDVVDIFTIHSDATRSQKEAIIENITENIKKLVSSSSDVSPLRIQPIITVREMEAWALADADAIAMACGSASWPANIPLRWNPTSVEDIVDPKEVLNSAIRDLYGGRKGRKIPTGAVFLDQIATEIDFEKLRRLDSFREFYEDIRDLLIKIRDNIK